MYERRPGIHCRVRAPSKRPPKRLLHSVMQESRRTGRISSLSPDAAVGIIDVS